MTRVCGGVRVAGAQQVPVAGAQRRRPQQQRVGVRSDPCALGVSEAACGLAGPQPPTPVSCRCLSCAAADGPALAAAAPLRGGGGAGDAAAARPRHADCAPGCLPGAGPPAPLARSLACAISLRHLTTLPPPHRRVFPGSSCGNPLKSARRSPCRPAPSAAASAAAAMLQGMACWAPMAAALEHRAAQHMIARPPASLSPGPARQQ